MQLFVSANTTQVTVNGNTYTADAYGAFLDERVS